MLLRLYNENSQSSSVFYMRNLLKFEALIVSFKVLIEDKRLDVKLARNDCRIISVPVFLCVERRKAFLFNEEM